jgi:hypothetical protein
MGADIVRRGHVAHGLPPSGDTDIVTRGPSTENAPPAITGASSAPLLLRGPAGEDGEPGLRGFRGEPGAAGAAGAAGEQGPRGFRGFDGEPADDPPRVIGVTSSVTGDSLLVGTGHPQGVVAASLGQLYRDRATGALYHKLGGASTVWGWYLVPSAYGQPWMHFDYYAINGSWVGVGITNGTGTASGTQSRGFFSDGFYFQNATGAGASATSTYSGDASTTAALRCTHDWDIVLNMRTDSSDITGTRAIHGIATVNVNLASAAPTASGIWFRYDTVAGDTQWMGYAHDGTTLSSATAIAAIAANTAYRLRIRKVGAVAYLSVNDAAEVTLSSNIPVGAVTVGPMMRVTTTGGAKALWSYYRGVSADFKGA